MLQPLLGSASDRCGRQALGKAKRLAHGGRDPRRRIVVRSGACCRSQVARHNESTGKTICRSPPLQELCGAIFLSGQGGFDPNTGKVVSDDLAEQTEQTFNNIETVLEAAGGSLDDVISCLVHLVDLADFPAFNAVYEQKFTGVRPVRTTVRADLVAGMLVEITVVARAS